MLHPFSGAGFVLLWFHLEEAFMFVLLPSIEMSFSTKLSRFTSQLDDKNENFWERIFSDLFDISAFLLLTFQNFPSLFLKHRCFSVSLRSFWKHIVTSLKEMEFCNVFPPTQTKFSMENNEFQAAVHIFLYMFVSGNDELSFFLAFSLSLYVKILLISSRLVATTTPHSRMKIECEENNFFCIYFRNEKHFHCLILL